MPRPLSSQSRNLDFHVGKYILRSPFKGSMKLDMEKAVWYLRRRLKLTDDLTGRDTAPAFAKQQYGAIDEILQAWSYLPSGLHHAVVRLLCASTWKDWNDFARDVRIAIESIEMEIAKESP